MTQEKDAIPAFQDVNDVEVKAEKPRRRFTAEDKRRIMMAADNCTKPGEITALLRREGIYWSYLSGWRKAVKKNGLVPKKRGPKPMPAEYTSQKEKIKLLEHQLEQATARAQRAEAVVELQKKVMALSELLPEIGLPS